jgi:hypothetical protein
MSSTQSEDDKMAAILGLLCSSEAGVARNGAKLLKPVTKKATCLMLLANQLRCNPHDHCRQRAADLLKDYLPKYYFKLSAANQILLKDSILPMVRNESNRDVAISITTVVIALAKTIFSKNHEWPELFIAVFQLGRSVSDHDRIMCFALLHELSEEAPEKLHPHTVTLANMFLVGIRDPTLSVVAAALSSLTAFIRGIGHLDEVLSLKPLLSPLIEVVQTFAANGYVEGFKEGLDVISQCLGLEVPLINDHIPDIVMWAISALQNETYNMKLRSAAATVLQHIIQHRPKLFCKSDLVAPVLRAVSDMLADGTYATGIIAEGCNDLLRPLLSGIVPLLVARMADTDPTVREIACFAMGQYAEHCQPEILHFHTQILPAICQVIQDREPMVAALGAYCAETYVEQLSVVTLRPFLQPLLLGFGELLQSPTGHIVDSSLSAIGSIAVAAETDFLPFTEVGTARMRVKFSLRY